MKKKLVYISIVLFVMLSCENAATLPISPEGNPPKQYIDNGFVKIGIDINSGGSVFFFSQSAAERNLLNHYDKGRFIQQSYYGITDGSMWAGKPWRWNPVQGGGFMGEAAKIIEKKVDKDSLYVKSRPKHWATGLDIMDATMEEKIILKDSIAHIHYTFRYSGTEVNHPATHQELPAVFVDAALPNLVFYGGDSPWTNGDITSVVPGWPNEGRLRTEEWAAYVDANKWGIGVYTPGTSNSTTYRYLGDGTVGPKGSACSYFAPVRTMKITPGMVFEYDVYLTIGSVNEIRKRFSKIHTALAN